VPMKQALVLFLAQFDCDKAANT